SRISSNVSFLAVNRAIVSFASCNLSRISSYFNSFCLSLFFSFSDFLFISVNLLFSFLILLIKLFSFSFAISLSFTLSSLSNEADSLIFLSCSIRLVDELSSFFFTACSFNFSMYQILIPLIDLIILLLFLVIALLIYEYFLKLFDAFP